MERYTKFRIRGWTPFNPTGVNIRAVIECNRPCTIGELSELLGNYGALDPIEETRPVQFTGVRYYEEGGSFSHGSVRASEESVKHSLRLPGIAYATHRPSPESSEERIYLSGDRLVVGGDRPPDDPS